MIYIFMINVWFCGAGPVAVMNLYNKKDYDQLIVEDMIILTVSMRHNHRLQVES